MHARLTFLLVALLLAAGCSGTPVSDPAQAAEVLMTTLALVADDDAEDKRREYERGEWTYCDVGCVFQRQLARERGRDATKRQQRQRETHRLQAEFARFMTDPRDAE